MPQGTVLGPLLLSLYINDIMVGTESEIRLFADDCVCYRQIDSTENTLKLLKDIDQLGKTGQEMGYEISAGEAILMNTHNIKCYNKIKKFP